MAKPRDVFLSDFLQDTATPLQWLLAWEAVAERDRLRTGPRGALGRQDHAPSRYVPIAEILAARSSVVA
jgi:hypothetical protein